MCSLEKQGNIYILTLTGDNEHRLNPTLLDSITAALHRIQSEATAPSALITTAHGKFFSNGYDLAWGQSDPDRNILMSKKLRLLIETLISFPMPTIAAVTGHASAADFDLLSSLMDNVDGNETKNGNEIALTSGRKKTVKNPPLWDNKTHLVFVELCLNEARLGNKPGTHFNKVGYENLIKKLKEKTGKDLTYKQIKNHWESMKKDWKLYDRLMRLDSGIGWDPIRNTIDASPEWWDEKIKADVELEKFRGQNLEMYKLYYDPLFRDTVAVGDRSKLPSDCRLVDKDEQQLEGKGDSDEINACDDQAPLFPESSSSKRKKSSNNGSVRSTKSKNSVTTEFDEKLDSVIHALSSRSTQSFPSHNSTPSTKDCMNIVTQYSGFEEGTKKYFEALKIFLKKEARENFMVPTNNEAKMGFLKYMMDK